MKRTLAQNSDLVSVVIPTYNCKKYIIQAILSVFNQTYKNIEIIVIDDGSNDGTERFLKRFSKKIKYIFTENMGVSSARNVGLRNARGNYIAFLDADDIWNKNKLSLQIEAFNRVKEIGAIFSNFSIIDEGTKILENDAIINHYGVFNKYDINWNNIFDKNVRQVKSITDEGRKNDVMLYYGNIFCSIYLGNFICTPSVIVKKSVLEKVGIFNENRKTQEDYELWLKIAKMYMIGYMNRDLVKIRKRANQMTSKNNNVEIAYNSLDIVEREKLYALKLMPIKLVRKRLKERYFHLAVTYVDKKYYIKALKTLAKLFTYKIV